MTVVIICETCGNKNDADADFCWFDGEPLEWVGRRVDEDTGQPVDESGAPDDSVYDVGPLYQTTAEPEPAQAAEPVAAAPPPPPVEAAPEPPPAVAPPAPEPEPAPAAAEPAPPAPTPEAAPAPPVPEPVAAAEPAPAAQEEEHDTLLKKLPGRRRKEAAQPAAAAPPAPAAPAPPAPAGRAAAPPPPPPSAPPTGPPSSIVPPPPTPAAPPAAPAGANGGTSAAPPAPSAPAAKAPPEAAPVKLTRAEEEKARKKAEEEEAARLAAEEEEKRKEAAKRLYIPVKTEPEAAPAPPPPPAPVVEEPVKLTWWQRFVAWLKRGWRWFMGLFTRKPKPAEAAAPAAPAAAAAPPAAAPAAGAPAAAPAAAAAAAAAVTQSTATPEAPAAKPPGAEVPTARPPGREKQTGPKVPSALKPTKEFERKARTEKKVEEAPQYEPGDLICTQCGTGNRPTNKFCKRCGSSLAEAPAAVKPSWFKRMLTKLHLRRRKQYEAGFRKRQKEGGKTVFWRLQGLSFRSVGLVFMAIAAVGLYAAWGPVLRQRFDRIYNPLHDRFLPSFTVQHPVAATASSHIAGHPPKNVIDQAFNTAWISKPTRTHGVLQTVTVYFDSPVKFGLVGFRNGAQTKKQELIPKYTRAKTVRIFYYGQKGKLIKGSSTVCNLDDKADFQKCGSVNLKDVTKVQVRVLAVYGRIGKTQSVALSAVETQRRK